MAGLGSGGGCQLLLRTGGHFLQLQKAGPLRLSRVQGLYRWPGEGRGPAGEWGLPRMGLGFGEARRYG